MTMPQLAQCLADSPNFRSKLKNNEESLSDAEARVDKLLKCYAAVNESGKQFAKNQVSFLACLHDWSSLLGDENDTAGPSSPEWNTTTDLTINSFGTFIESLCFLLDQTGKSIESTLKCSLREDIIKVKETKKQFEKISDELDNCLHRSLQIPIAKASEAEEADNMLTATRSCFYHVSLEYVNQLNCLDLKKRQVILELLLSFSAASKTFLSKAEPIQNSLNSNTASIEDMLAKFREQRDSVGKHLEKCQAKVNKFTHLPIEDASNEIRLEGYLLKKSSNAFKTWNRRWFIIRDHKLMYSKRSGDHADQTVMVEDLRLCSIKSYEIERRFCFEVVSPGKSHVLQAESEEACRKWMDVLNASIDAAYNEIKSHHMKRNQSAENLLSSSINKGSKSSKSSLSSDANVSHLSDSYDRRSIRPSLELLLEKGNSRCCDCNSPDPKWASINLGITLCIECSGIHRSLGVHVSKVRSLTLDDWEPTWVKILSQLGNDTCNSVYESKVEKNISRIASDSSREAREKWIKGKYLTKKFVQLSPEYLDQLVVNSDSHLNHTNGVKVETCNELLHQAVQDGNFKNILHSLALGADINSKFLGLTSLHHAVQSNKAELTEFLLLNGAKINYTDALGQTPLNLAIQCGNKGQVGLLIKRGADLKVIDTSGRDLLAIALEKADADIVTLLRLAELTEEMKKHEPGNDVTEELLADMVRDFSSKC